MKSRGSDSERTSKSIDFISFIRIVVILEPKIYVYNFQNLKLIEVIETNTNQKGICAVSPSKEVCVLAAPEKKIGTVRVVHFDKGSKT